MTIKADLVSDENKFVQSVSLNGRPLNRAHITHDELIQGGELVFKMGGKVNKNWGSDSKDLPYSLSKE